MESKIFFSHQGELLKLILTSLPKSCNLGLMQVAMRQGDLCLICVLDLGRIVRSFCNRDLFIVSV